MLLSKTVKQGCYSGNKNKLIGLGYEWKLSSYVDLKVEYLSEQSNVEVKVECDYCGTKMMKPFYAFSNGRKHIPKDSCKKCNGTKQKEVNMILYGTIMSPKKIEAIKNLRHSFSFIESEFESKGYKLIDTEYVNADTKMKYTCNIHPKDVQEIIYRSLMSGHGCMKCALEKMVKYGSDSHLWRGGISKLSSLVRERINEWKMDSLASTNYRCFITGKKDNLHVHHLINFNAILNESLECLNLKINESVSDYTQEEIDSIISTCLTKHYEYGLGIPLNKEIHHLYHATYGKEDSCPEDFLGFCNLNFNMGLKLEDITKKLKKSHFAVKKDIYFPEKKDATSRFHGISKTSLYKWSYQLRSNGTVLKKAFYSELEAAHSYNLKRIELFGEDTTINFLTEDEIKIVDKTVNKIA